MDLQVLRLDPGLPKPVRAHPDDAGLDLRARIDVTVSAVTPPVRVPTGIAVAIPAGHVGLVCSRSGLAADRGIAVLNSPGIVDPGYRGEVHVVLFSVVETAFTIRRGERVAQLLVIPVSAVRAVYPANLPAGSRGSAGFGSTGG